MKQKIASFEAALEIINTLAWTAIIVIEFGLIFTFANLHVYEDMMALIFLFSGLASFAVIWTVKSMIIGASACLIQISRNTDASEVPPKKEKIPPTFSTTN